MDRVLLLVRKVDQAHQAQNHNMVQDPVFVLKAEISLEVGATWASWVPRVRVWARQARPDKQMALVQTLDRALWGARRDLWELLEG